LAWEVLNVAINANGAFLEPLPYSEVKATAKSVSRWVWRNHGKAYAKFIERQAVKGRKGGLVSDSSHGKARSAAVQRYKTEALKLHIQGIKQTNSDTVGCIRSDNSEWIKVKVQA
jgi:hypothetical protein